MKLSNDQMKELYYQMRLIREFETNAQLLFADGRIPGFVHLSTGQEAVSAGICGFLRDDDFVTTNHRGHGHIIAKGGDPKKMMAELYGKETGYCKGKGGSMHIANMELGVLGANGIVGAGLPLAVGAGLSASVRGTDQVSVCFFGDASTNQGTFHEALNLASIWKLPVVFICENNFYGISMSQERHQAIKDIADRGVSYNIPGMAIDGNDVMAVYETTQEAIARVRKGQGPVLIECKTYRHRGHFEGDPTTYRPKEEVAAWMAKDPIERYKKTLIEENIATAEEIEALNEKAIATIKEAIEFAESSSYAGTESVGVDVYSDIIEEVRVR